MKDNIKKILFTISIFYSIIVIILMVINLSNLVTTVELYDSEENLEKINKYKEQLSLIEQNNCTKIINKIIKRYEETSYEGKVSIKEMYDYDFDNGLLLYYSKVKEACNLSDSDIENYNLPSKFITASIQRDELYQRYYFQYELNITDFYMRDIAEAALSSIEYKISKDTELEIISILIEISSREVIVNE